MYMLLFSPLQRIIVLTDDIHYIILAIPDLMRVSRSKLALCADG